MFHRFTKSLRPFNQITKRNPFSLAFYKKTYEVIPIVCLAICDVMWMTFCPIRTLFVSDCNWSRWATLPEDRLDLLIHPRDTKLIHVSQVLEPNQELYDLYQEMKKAEEELKKKEAEEAKERGE